jgi:predicted transcriptional regulator
MGKHKKEPKYNVLSIRLTEEEKKIMSKMMRETRKSVSVIMREAMHNYTSLLTTVSPGEYNFD